jgi:hypothetical protein
MPEVEAFQRGPAWPVVEHGEDRSALNRSPELPVGRLPAAMFRSANGVRCRIARLAPKGESMKKRTLVLVIAGAMAFGGATAGAAPDKKDHSPGPKSGKAEKRKAYGKYCQGEGKKHVNGQKKTPFSVCASGAKKLIRDQAED